AELLHAVDVGLRHAPGAVGRVGRTRRETGDPALDGEVPRHVGDEVAHRRGGVEGLDRRPLLEATGRGGRQTHDPGPPVYLPRARAALPGLAVPAAGEIGRLLRLDAMHGVEHHHALADLGAVVLESPRAALPPPDPERRARHVASLSLSLL